MCVMPRAQLRCFALTRCVLLQTGDVKRGAEKDGDVAVETKGERRCA